MKVIFSKQTSCGPNKDSKVKYVKIWQLCSKCVYRHSPMVLCLLGTCWYALSRLHNCCLLFT